MESLVSYVFSFSHRTNRQLKIIYVYDYKWIRQANAVGFASEADPVLVNSQTSAKKEFEEAEVRIRDIVHDYLLRHSVDVPVDVLVSDKNRIDLVNQEARSFGDVVIMVSSSQSSADAAGGAVGYPNIIDNLNYPLFVIPDNTSYAVLKNVLYATNFHPDDISSLRHLSQMLNVTDFNLSILHNEKDAGFEDNLRWKGFLELIKQQTGIQSLTPVLMNENRTLDAIEKYVHENNIDLLVVLKEDKGFFKEIFSSGHTKKILTHLKIPVMVYHEN